MDGSRFDVLTHAFSQGLSRRRIVHVLVTAIIGDALGLVEGEVATCPGLGVSSTCDSDDDCAACGDAVCQATACRRPTGGKCKKGRHCAANTGTGCVRHAQCCSGNCGADGRCAS
jgi:hypothetical protein